MVVLLTALIGRSFSSCTRVGLLFRSTSYSNCPIFEVPDGRIRFCCADRVHHIGGRKSLGLQQVGPDVDHHLALLAAVGIRNRRALHGGERGSNVVGREVEKLLLGEPFAGKRELQDGHARSVVDQDERRRGARRHLADGGAAPCAVTCATAISIFTLGWKKILTMLRPFTVCDSMCSMSLTVVVRLRSNCVVMRSSISSAFRPV